MGEESTNKLLGTLEFNLDPVEANLKRLEALANRMGTTGKKLEQQFQNMTMGGPAIANMAKVESATNGHFANIENRAKQHRTFMDRLFSQQMLAHHMNWMIAGVGIYGTFEVMKEGLIDIEKGMKGLQTVLPEIAHDQEKYNQTTKEAIDLMQKYGAGVDEVMSSGRSLGRMYKDINTVMGLTNNSILLNVIDNVRLEDAVRGNEAALSIYGKELKSTNEVLAFSGKLMDSLTRLSHESMAQASDLIQILQQSGGAAKEARVELDQLLGVGASAVRATGLQNQGGNLGRMLRTVFVQLSAPTKAVEETIEKIGVKMRDANGELRNAYDIILDLSLATKDAKISQEDLNNAILKASSGKFQYSKLAALVGQFDEIIKNTARSIHSQGVTAQMAAQQLDTLERHAKMLKATLVDTFSGAGDAGLRTAIKGMLDTLNQLIMGFNHISPAAINAGLGIGALVLAGKMIIGVYGRVLPIVGAVTGITAQVAAASNMAAAGQMSLATATNVTGAAMSRLTVTTALATGGLTLLLGGLAYLVYKSGEAEKKQMELNQATQESIQLSRQKVIQYETEVKFLDQMKAQHQELSEKIDRGKLSVEELAAAQKDRGAVEEAVLLLVDQDIRKKIESNGVTQEEINLVIESAKQKKQAEVEKTRAEIKETNEKINATNQRIGAIKRELEAEQTLLMAKSPVRLGVEAAVEIKYPNLARALGLGKATGLQGELQRVEKEYGDAQKHLTELQMSFIQGIGDINRLAGGGDSDGKPKLSDFTAPLRESVNDVRNALTQYNDAISLTDTLIQGVGSQEKTLDMYIKNQKIPTMEQVRQKYTLLNNEMALQYRKQTELHNAAEETRKQLKPLTDQMAAFKQQHESGALTVDQFNAAVNALRPTINSLEKDIAQYGNQWWQAEQAIGAAKDAQADMVRTFIRSTRELQKENALDALAKSQKSALDTMEQQKKKALDDLEEAQKARIRSLESSRDTELKTLKDTKDAYEETSNAKIKAIQAEIDALELENDLLNEQEELISRQKAVEEARTKIANIEADKKIRVVGADGQWTYITDEIALREARRDLEDAEKALANTQADIRKNARRRELDAQIKQEQDVQKTQLDSYDKQIEAARKTWDDKLDVERDAQQKEKNQQQQAWDKRLDDFREAQANEKTALENHWAGMLDAERINQDAMNEILRLGLDGALAKWRNYYDQVKSLQQAQQLPPGVPSGGIVPGGGSGSSGGGDPGMPPGVPTGGIVPGSYVASGYTSLPSESSLNSDFQSGVRYQFDSGGPIPKDMIAQLHAKEYVLNAKTVASLGGFAGVERLVATINMSQSQWRMPQINPAQTSTSITNDRRVQILGDIKLPHVYDASGLIRNLEQYAAG